MKNSSDTIGNRNRDLPRCSTVPQPTAPPRALLSGVDEGKVPACNIGYKASALARKLYRCCTVRVWYRTPPPPPSEMVP
jgi:hypothetical protein